MTMVYVAAGSTVEPLSTLRLALDALAAAFPGLQCSPAYRNRAVGFEGEEFVNLVVGFDTDLDPRAVQASLQQVESRCGRARDAPKWAPRSMDLDILLYGDEQVREPGLRIPHPEMARRAFVLVPLADVAASGLSIPACGPLSDLLEACGRDGITRISGC